MLLKEHQVRRVIRRTIVENNYRVNERFYRNLHANLMTEGFMDVIKDIPNLIKKSKSSDEKVKKEAMPKAKKSILLLKLMPLVFMLNTVSTGQVMAGETLKNYRAAQEIAAQLGMDNDFINPSEMNTEDLSDFIKSNKNLLSRVNALKSGVKLADSASEVNADLDDIIDSQEEDIAELEVDFDIFQQELNKGTKLVYDSVTGEDVHIDDLI